MKVKVKTMYCIFNRVDGERSKTFSSEEFVKKVRQIAKENGDDIRFISNVKKAKDYIDNYADNLSWFEEPKLEI